MTAPKHTVVPEVRAALQDSVLPDAFAALPATITVAGTSWPLKAPVILYGPPAAEATPGSAVLIGNTDGDDQQMVALPDTPSRSRDERFNLKVLVWYQIGDQDPSAQRACTEAAYTIFRAIADQIRTDPTLGGALASPGRAHLTRASDTDYKVAEGRAFALRCLLAVYTKV